MRARTLVAARFPPWWLVLAAAAAMAQVVWLIWGLARAIGGGVAVDFLAFDAGARLVGSDPQHLYGTAAQAHAEVGLLGYNPGPGASFPQQFVNPPFAAEILRPLSGLALQAATDVFSVLMLVCLLVAVSLISRHMERQWRWPKPVAAAIALVLGLPTAAGYAISLGQWDPLLLLAAVAAQLQAARGHPRWAGVMLAVLLIKPQVVWLLLPTVVLMAEWDVLLGFVLAAVVLAAASVAAVGLAECLSWVGVALGFASTAAGAGNGQNLPGLVVLLLDRPGLESDIALPLAVVGLVAVLTLRRRLRGRSDAVIAVALTISVMTAPHLNVQDLVVLVPLALLLLPRAPRAGLLLVVAAEITAAQISLNHPLRTDTVVCCIAVALAYVAIRRGLLAAVSPPLGEGVQPVRG